MMSIWRPEHILPSTNMDGETRAHHPRLQEAWFNGYLPDRETTPDLRSIAVQSLPRLQAEATNAFNLPLLGPTLSSLLTCRFLHL